MDQDTILHELTEQVEAIDRHINQGSIQTRWRYHAAILRFCAFLAEFFGLLKLVNVEERHVMSYVRYMLKRGLSGSTIRNELSAIRFYHDQMSRGRHRLPSNERIEKLLGHPLPERSEHELRAWNDEEYERALELAEQRDDDDIALMLRFARTLGLRLHETVRLTRSILRTALGTGYLTIKGKGGKVRDVPLTGAAIATIKCALDRPNVSEKIFVPAPSKAHLVMKRCENWIYRLRPMFADGPVRLTYHGLRHAFARERVMFHYNRLGDWHAALVEVSRELGHERRDVTMIYLAGLKGP